CLLYQLRAENRGHRRRPRPACRGPPERGGWPLNHPCTPATVVREHKRPPAEFIKTRAHSNRDNSIPYGVSMKAVIADDEPLARERIRTLLAGEDDIEIVAEAANGADAVQVVREHRPDLLFLD